MIPQIRKQFNHGFTQEKYRAFLQETARAFGEAPAFRVAETPIFIPSSLRQKLEEACDEINDFICGDGFHVLQDRVKGLPFLLVPNEDHHTLFLQYDFAVCRDEQGELHPQLIEMQGFPSLYFYQHLLALSYRKVFDIPDNLTHLFCGLDDGGFVELLRRVIVGDRDPKNVILLEVEPEKQNTRVDFWASEKIIGIKTICLTKLKRSGKELYYIDEAGRKVPVYRIFNRVIFDELLQRDDLPREFNLTEEIDAEWAGHPNWFMKISKFTMPFVDSRFVPKSYFLNELDRYPDDLENYVLKPLFSFSGKGVKFHVQREDLEQVKRPEEFILQHKIAYAPVIETPQNPAKCEIRMMMVWKPGEDRPRLATNLVRLTKGDMVGVRYNINQEWVGSSVGFMEHF
jgi:hypothetical protein